MAELEIFPESECRIAYGDDFDDSRQICAGDRNWRIDTCEGDSGGSLHQRFYQPQLFYPYQNTTWNNLIGITSYGKGCQSAFPAVYTRVSAYVDWLRNASLPN